MKYRAAKLITASYVALTASICFLAFYVEDVIWKSGFEMLRQIFTMPFGIIVVFYSHELRSLDTAYLFAAALNGVCLYFICKALLYDNPKS